MRIYDKIVESPFAPQLTTVLWLRPVGDGFSFYRFTDGEWKALKIMDSMGTATPYDDEIADVSNIPEIVKEVIPGVIGDSVEEEVRNQIEQIDFTQVNKNSTPSGDEDDYPEVVI